MESGSRIDRNELPTGSLRQYLSTASKLQLEDTFNRLAKWLLEKERGKTSLSSEYCCDWTVKRIELQGCFVRRPVVSTARFNLSQLVCSVD